MIRASLALAAFTFACAANAAPELSPVWTDNAVIQRGRPIVVEGNAAPGARISATLGEAHGSATADADGRFAVAFPARTASEQPIALHVTDGTEAVTSLENLVVGDVWLCSGQSNMAFTVAAGLNGFNNIQSSADPLLRMINVPLDTAASPQREFGGEAEWKQAGPETTGGFSAACYYMLRELRDALGIPMGAVHASWGGSQIRPWLTPQGGAALYGPEQMLMLTGHSREPLAAVTAFAPAYEAWWREHAGAEPWKDPSAVAWQPVPDISPWSNWTGTPLAENGVANVLLRRSISLTPEQAAAGGVLNIGIIDDLDATWVNGRAVGFTHGWGTEREYRVPPELLRAGNNDVLVIATNSWGLGGFNSSADRLSFSVEGGERISLAEDWQFAIGEPPPMPPRAPWDANAGIGVMHNRMVAPVGSFAMTGAAWYQGESDVGIPGYADRMRELFAGWRRQFGAEMRMLVVQLADYGPTAAEPVESGWAAFRDVQRRAVEADGNAALVTAVDIGEPTDIHPANKVVLGERLALAAQGRPMPMPISATRRGDTVVVRFSGVEGGLRSLSGPFALAVELCGDTQESCRFASAAVNGDAMAIRGDGLPATRVRYAWADSPVVNTYDARALPLPGFELPIEP